MMNGGARPTATVCVNGELSAPIAIETGVAQGDPLSPLLFNLFLQSLSSWLSTRPDLHGARVNSPGPHNNGICARIRRLFYADDVALFAETRAELQLALNYVQQWAEAWGMRINCSATKTEAILFTPPVKDARLRAALPAPLTCGANIVHFVDSYLYLGRRVCRDLRATRVDHVTGIVAAFTRNFTFNDSLRRAAASSQLQVLKTCVLGAVNYLRGIDISNLGDLSAIDVGITSAARLIVGLPKSACNALAFSTAGLLTAAGVNAREAYRVWQQLRLTPFQGLDVVRVTRAASQVPGGRDTGPTANWAKAVPAFIRREEARGACTHPAASYPEIAASAFVFGRSVSWNELRRDVRRHHPEDKRIIPQGDNDAASLPPTSRGSRNHWGWLVSFMWQTASSLGRAKTTPLSAVGPGCSGSLLALADGGRYKAVAMMMCGDEALACEPFADPNRKAEASAFADRFSNGPCRLCGAAQSRSIYHLITSCPHEAMRRARARLVASVPDILRAILEGCSTAMVGQPPAAPGAAPATAGERAALEQITREGGAVPDSDDGRMLTYRLLSGVPWGRDPLARGAVFPASAAVGAVFDATNAPPSELRVMASQWLCWAEYQLRHNIARSWRVALRLPVGECPAAPSRAPRRAP
jgi:hypothetical protein